MVSDIWPMYNVLDSINTKVTTEAARMYFIQNSFLRILRNNNLINFNYISTVCKHSLTCENSSKHVLFILFGQPSLIYFFKVNNTEML